MLKHVLSVVHRYVSPSLPRLSRCRDPRAVRLGIRSLFTFFLGLFCWVNDRLFCTVWQNAHFPYLHGFWHVLIFLSSYTCCVLMVSHFANMCALVCDACDLYSLSQEPLGQICEKSVNILEPS